MGSIGHGENNQLFLMGWLCYLALFLCFVYRSYGKYRVEANLVANSQLQTEFGAEHMRGHDSQLHS